MKSTPEQLEYWRNYRREHRDAYRAYYATVKEIKKKQLKEWCLKNRDRRRASSQKYLNAHRLELYAKNKKWRSENKEKLIYSKREYAIKNKLSIQAKMKVYHKSYYAKPEVKERILKQSKQWHKDNPEKVRMSFRKWMKKHPEVGMANNQRRRALKKKATINLKGIKAFISSVKSKRIFICYYCQQDFEISKLHFDHIVPLSKGGLHSVENLCASCNSCNQSKHSKTVEAWVRIGQQVLSL